MPPDCRVGIYEMPRSDGRSPCSLWFRIVVSGVLTFKVFLILYSSTTYEFPVDLSLFPVCFLLKHMMFWGSNHKQTKLVQVKWLSKLNSTEAMKTLDIRLSCYAAINWNQAHCSAVRATSKLKQNTRSSPESQQRQVPLSQVSNRRLLVSTRVIAFQILKGTKHMLNWITTVVSLYDARCSFFADSTECTRSSV